MAPPCPARCAAAGHKNIQITVEEKGDKTVVRIERDIETDIPAFAKKVVDAVNHVVDVLEWRTSGEDRVGTYHVTVTKRISVSGRMEIRKSGDGCVYRDTCDPKVDMPLIGKKIAKLVETETVKQVGNDLAFTDRAL